MEKECGLSRNDAGIKSVGIIVEIEMLMLREVVIGGMEAASVFAGKIGVGEVVMVAVAMAVILDNHAAAEGEAQRQAKDNVPQGRLS